MNNRIRVIAGACAVTLTLLGPSVGSATAPHWWFQLSSFRAGIKPITGVPSIIASGETDGQRWTAVGYIGSFWDGKEFLSNDGEICVGVIYGQLTDHHGRNGCGLLRGMPNAQAGSWASGGIGAGSLPGQPTIVSFAVAKGVARAVIVLNANSPGKRKTVTVHLRHIPAIGGGIRFFALSEPAAEISSISFYNSDGRFLQGLNSSPEYGFVTTPPT